MPGVQITLTYFKHAPGGLFFGVVMPPPHSRGLLPPQPFTCLTQVTAAAVRPRHSSCVKRRFSMTYRAARRRAGAHRLPLCASFLADEERMSARVRQVWSGSCFLQSNPESPSSSSTHLSAFMADDVCQSPRRPNPAYYASDCGGAPHTAASSSGKMSLMCSNLKLESPKAEVEQVLVLLLLLLLR